MKNYIRPFLSFSLALLLTTTTPVFAAPSRGNANNGAVRSTSRSNVNQPAANHSASSNRSANDNKNTNNNRNTNVNNNTNVNRNTNVNKNTNVNVNRDVNVNTHSSYNSGYNGGGGCCYHSGVGVAAAVATTAVVTAAIVGSRVNTLPSELHDRCRQRRHLPAVRRQLLSAAVLRRKHDLCGGQPAVNCHQIAPTLSGPKLRQREELIPLAATYNTRKFPRVCPQ